MTKRLKSSSKHLKLRLFLSIWISAEGFYSNFSSKRPTFLELASYVCNFQGIVVGPLCYYRDYIDFVTGHNILKHSKQTKEISGSDGKEPVQAIQQPSILVNFELSLFFSSF